MGPHPAVHAPSPAGPRREQRDEGRDQHVVEPLLRRALPLHRQPVVHHQDQADRRGEGGEAAEQQPETHRGLSERGELGEQHFVRNSRKNPTGFPSAYFVTSSGITWIQRAEAVGTGRNPHASVIVSLVKIALANQTPTAIRRNASQRSGERIAEPVDTTPSIGGTPRVRPVGAVAPRRRRAARNLHPPADACVGTRADDDCP